MLLCYGYFMCFVIGKIAPRVRFLHPIGKKENQRTIQSEPHEDFDQILLSE